MIALVPAPRTAPVAAPVKVLDRVLPPVFGLVVTVGILEPPVPLVVIEVGLVAGVETVGFVVVVFVVVLVGFVTEVNAGLEVEVPAVALPAMTELGFAVVFVVKDAGVVFVPIVGTAVLVLGVLVVETGLEPEPTLVMLEVPTKEDAGFAPVPILGLSTVPTPAGRETLVRLPRPERSAKSRALGNDFVAFLLDRIAMA
jgi:hypothetical protein